MSSKFSICPERKGIETPLPMQCRRTRHRLRPVIDRTFPFAEAKAAYRHFEGRSHFGKVVITQG
jgi:hypothetical protein